MKPITWSIGRKLAIGFAVVIILTIAVGVIGLFALNTVKREVVITTTLSAQLKDLSNLINTSLLQARRSEKDFFLRYKSNGIAQAKAEYVTKVQAEVAAIHQYATEAARLATTEADIERFRQIEKSIDNYQTNFLQAVGFVEQHGYVDSGLEGEFRVKIHEIEDAVIEANQDRLTIDILTIRRHEKDYLLRGNQEYINQVTQSVAQFKQDLSATTLSAANQTRLNTLADEYLALFTQLTQIDVDLAAAIERFREDAHAIEPIVAEMSATSTEQFQTSVNRTNETISTTNVMEISALVLATLLGFSIAILAAKSIVNPILVITAAARKLAVGDVNQTIQVRSQDEIGVMADAFRQMIAYQQHMAGVAGRLTQGDVAVSITPQSDGDVLGQSFTRMVAYQQQMAEAAKRLAQGDLTANITPQSDDDALGHAFSLMIANLRILVNQIIDTANTVNAASGQLATTADQASQAGQQVAATIQQVAIGTTQQTQAVTDATGNTEQLARAADGIAKGAQEQAQSVQKTSILVGEMSQIVEQVGQIARAVSQANTKVTQAARHSAESIQQTTQGMDTIRSRSLATADKVKEMGHRSKEISRIVETIDDIADKTDMLALNAAVEAARAGEHGRGFAVVAEQVRKLSEDSKGATRDISDLVERVQDSVREAITAVENTVAEVSNGVQLAGDTAKSLQEILQATDEAAIMAEQIDGATAQLRQKSEGVVSAIESVSAVVEENTAAAEEMAASAQEVMQAIEGVASVAEENSASAEEVSASSEEMSAQVEEVLASAQELSLLAEQLRTVVAQFGIEEERPTQPARPGQSTSSLYATPNRQRPKTTPILVGQGNGQLDEH